MSEVIAIDVDEEVQRPTCPVCLDLCFGAFMAVKCGHTICITCKEGIRKNECPFCRKPTSFTENYMVRTLLENPKYRNEMEQRKKAHFLTTPSGQIAAFQDQYPNVTFPINDYPPEETALFLQFLRGHFNYHATLPESFFDTYGVKVTFIARATTYSLNRATSPYFLVVDVNGAYYIFMTRKLHFAPKNPKKRSPAAPNS